MRTERQPAVRHRRARGRVRREIRRVHLIHLREVPHVGQEHRALHHPLERAAGVDEQRLDVLERLTGLARDPRVRELRRPRHEAELARQVEHVADAHRGRKRQPGHAAGRLHHLTILRGCGAGDGDNEQK